MSHIIITGANQGIGYYMVEQFLAEGHHVAVLDIEIEQLQSLRTKYPEMLFPYLCDMRVSEQVTDVVNAIAKHFTAIDIAIHNACICTFESFESSTEDIFKTVLDVNYFGGLRLSKACIPHMKAQGKGEIIYTSSGVGVTGFAKLSPYASSKAALESLAKCLNLEFGRFGIRFRLIQPPLTRTRSAAPLPVPDEFMADAQKVGNRLAKRIHSKSFLITHSFGQKIQTRLSYLFPIATGRLLNKMTSAYKAQSSEKQ